MPDLLDINSIFPNLKGGKLKLMNKIKKIKHKYCDEKETQERNKMIEDKMKIEKYLKRIKKENKNTQKSLATILSRTQQITFKQST